MITVYHYVCELTGVNIVTTKNCGEHLQDNNGDIYDFVGQSLQDFTDFNMAFDKESVWQGGNDFIKPYEK
jgi:hypothetical protein